ncbi:putative inosine-5'-monophosphate dehydrogenase protein [Caenispirillum salinarum AK4]|uniref:Putative inosine-5'-monophosphate dehydrogenase protein n=1 Tax=Caenispirillum salinarum AK4 TaxID=1238182 RepID=K9HCD9_9PROT|nr:CBS domain-containing protein [Caenispirillum salinarum]EKV28188.1 putative inosine-5'-monophosphate dehydrogenase protein [Caenispirillum salinarum AK4]
MATRIKEVMTKNVRLADPKMSLKECANAMREDNIGMMPVSDDGRLVGTITDRDITLNGTAKGLDPNNTRVAQAMTEGVEYVFDEDTVDEAARVMADRQVRRLAVLNAQKELVGMIATADLATHVRSSGPVDEAVRGVSQG